MRTLWIYFLLSFFSVLYGVNIVHTLNEMNFYQKLQNIPQQTIMFILFHFNECNSIPTEHEKVKNFMLNYEGNNRVQFAIMNK